MSEAENNSDEDAKFFRELDDFVHKVGERCLSVRLIVVVPKGSGEESIYTVGDGNFYSQLASTREWLMRQDEQTKAQARKDFDDT